MSARPLVISHAACAGHAPANTLAGVERAIALGAEAIEIDVHTSADGVPVVIHDRTLDRTTDGSGNVRDTPLAALRALSAAAGEPDWPQREPVPTLEQVVEATRGRAMLVIEVKPAGIEQAVLDVLRAAGATDGLMVWSFRAEVVARFRALEPALPAALLVGRVESGELEAAYDAALRANAQACSLHHSLVTAQSVQAARRRGLGPYTWTVNDEAEMRRVRDCGVDGIVSDYPDQLSQALDGPDG